MKIESQIKTVVTRLEAAGHPFDVIDGSDRSVALEARFGRRLPPSFRCLIAGYAFPEIEIGGVTVFSNLNDGSRLNVQRLAGRKPVQDRAERFVRVVPVATKKRCEHRVERGPCFSQVSLSKKFAGVAAL